MSQSGFTPIQLYRTSTAAAVPTAGNLAAGELAINLTDEALYFKNAAGVVKLLADSSGALGTVTSVDVSGGTTGLTTSGGPITSSGTITLAGTLGVANGGTGTATAFTAGSVVFAGASGVYTQDNANLFWDNTNDRLGIGTATPSVPLDVTENGVNSGLGYSNVSKFVDGSGNKGLMVGYDNSAQTTVLTANSTSASSNMAFWTYEAGGSGWGERMRITSAGNVGIGTSSPGSALQVNGNIRVSNGTGFTTGNSLIRSIQSMSGSTNQFVSNSIDFYTAAFTDNGQIAFSTGTTERMRIDGSGNVGIGTSSPAAKLHTVSTAGFTAPNLLCTDTVGTFRVVFQSSLYAGVPANKPWLHSYDDIYIGSDATTSFNVISGGVNRLIVNSSGNVGIGAAPTAYSNAQSSLQVKGFNTSNAGHISAITSAADGWVSLFSGTTAADNPAITWQSGGTLRFATTTNPAVAGFTERMRIDSSGSLLVGTTTGSTSRLIVTGSGSVDMFTFTGGSAGTNYGVFRNQAGTAYGIIGGGGGGALSGGATTDFTIRAENNLLLAIGNTERARIDSSGNLLVGTTAAEGPGKIVSVSTVSGTACVAMRNSAGASSNYAFFINAAATTIIGSITNNADTGVLYNVTSDARAKHDIIDAPEASSLIDAIQVRSFKWNASNNEQRYGFIAQELVEVAPEAVSQPEDPDDMMGVDYSKLVPMLVKELQSLRARVAQLEGN